MMTSSSGLTSFAVAVDVGVMSLGFSHVELDGFRELQVALSFAHDLFDLFWLH